MLAFACPHCSLPLQVAAALAGKATACPHCGRSVAVPPLAPPALSAKQPAAAEDRTEGAAPPQMTETQAYAVDEDSGLVTSGPGSGDLSMEPGILGPPQEPDEIGRLGPYRVQKILGAGGMGIVFQAQDPVLKRPVAIKAMLPTVAARAGNRERFLREAQTAAALESDYIVPIYQVGEERGLPFLVMRLLQGETLEARLAREKVLPVPESLRIAREIAEGLSAAHERNLMHRDIKPANIWLEAPRGRVKILDFGLARTTADDSGLTQTGVILGTPAYMAPEQARGKPGDQRGDLFSLGCVLYQMSTGRLPFHGTDTLSRLLALSLDEPKPPRDCNAAIPADMADLITQLLVKNPAHRFPSAVGVVEAIEVIESANGFKTHLAAPPALGPAADLAPGEIFSFADQDAVFEDEEDETQAPPAVADSAGGRSADWVREVEGETLGRYEVGPLLGRGRHGAVYRARDVRDGGEVALKVLNPVFPCDEEEARPFIRAMRPLLGLRHPNVVSLLGAGKSGPYCWMALEYVEGETLTARVRRLRSGSQKIDWRRALRVAVHVGRALEFADQNHLSHRNVTPENILWEGEAKVAKLGDLMFREAIEHSELHAEVAGEKEAAELPYRSPEEVEGGEADAISDLYSLGAVVYALLTGRPPFEGASADETARKILKEDVVKPRKQLRAIPADFEWVVTTMLARGRQYRFQTAAELLVHLERIAMEKGLVL